MKRLFIITAVSIGLGFFTQSKAQGKKDPYKATYSSNFSMGKQAQASMILDLWKDWDDNAFDRHDYFADTITMYFADGTTTRGKTANMEAAKKYRGMMTKVNSVIHAWLPLRSNDRNEDLVCVWGQEENTFADGRVEKRSLHEVWWFNKDGKISGLRQWASKIGE